MRKNLARTIRPLMVALLLSISIVAWAGEPPEAMESESVIREVTVFPSMARIVRSGSVTFARTGPIQVDLVRLSDRMHKESFQLNGQGNAKVRILGTSLERVFATKDVDARIAELTAKLDDLRMKERAYNDEKSAIEGERKFVESLLSTYAKDQSGNMATKRLSVQDWRNAGKFVSERLAALAGSAREIDGKLKTLREDIKEVQTELNKLRSKRGNWTTTAHLDLEVLKAGTFRFEAAYLLPGAHWGMVYDARLDMAASQVEIGCFASVTQTTGEDWERVELILSTARPSVDGTIPELHPRYIDIYSPPPPAPSSRNRFAEKKERRAFSETMAVGGMADMDDAGVAEEAAQEYELDVPQATVDTVGLATFTAPRKTGIPSDNRTHRVFLLSKSWKAATHYEIVPELSPSAFLAAKTTNPFEFPLLAGSVNLYQGQNYVGRAYLNTAQSGEEFLLPFGLDDGIKVERKQIQRKTGESGVINKDTDIVYHYRVSVANHRRSDTVVRVYERFPVSRNEKLKVDILEKTTAGWIKDPDKPGVIHWETPLAAGKKTEYDIRYKITYPKNRQVTGMP